MVWAWCVSAGADDLNCLFGVIWILSDETIYRRLGMLVPSLSIEHLRLSLVDRNVAKALERMTRFDCHSLLFIDRNCVL